MIWMGTIGSALRCTAAEPNPCCPRSLMNKQEEFFNGDVRPGVDAKFGTADTSCKVQLPLACPALAPEVVSVPLAIITSLHKAQKPVISYRRRHTRAGSAAGETGNGKATAAARGEGLMRWDVALPVTSQQ